VFSHLPARAQDSRRNSVEDIITEDSNPHLIKGLDVDRRPETPSRFWPLCVVAK